MILLKRLRFGGVTKSSMNTTTESKEVMVRPGRFERPTFCSGGKRSIQLSYGRTRFISIVEQSPPRSRRLRRGYSMPSRIAWHTYSCNSQEGASVKVRVNVYGFVKAFWSSIVNSTLKCPRSGLR